jgi:hypothetical protein
LAHVSLLGSSLVISANSVSDAKADGRIFWINVPTAIPTLVGFACCLRTTPRHISPWTAMRRTDWTGLCIVTASLTGILFALNSGNAVYPWISAPILVPLVCGSVGLPIFAAYEYFIAGDSALLPGRLFANITAAAGYGMTICHAMIMWSMTYYLFLYVCYVIPILTFQISFFNDWNISSLTR